MSHVNRRAFLGTLAAGAALGTLGLPSLVRAGGPTARVVVVGGGYGGATCAKYLRVYDQNIDVTLIEPKERYVSCPFSNEVLGGDGTMEGITFGYENLARRGVNVIKDRVTDIRPAQHQVATQGGLVLSYDMIVVAPGISMRWGALEGYDEAAAEKMPHSWQAGPQTVLLKKQLEAMPEGGVVMISAPANPFRCPPGPYERAAQIAHFLTHHKPRAKLIILDSKDAFSKQGLFMAGYKRFYEDLIEWRPAAADGRVIAVDADKGLLMTEFDDHKPDVANVVPPQTAGALAHALGLTDDSGWCPVDQKTFASTVAEDVYVIGDACIAGAMPKSAYSATSQAKACAMAIATRVNGLETPAPSFLNTCYSLISPDYGISVAAVYAHDGEKIVGVEGAGGVTPADASLPEYAAEADYARSWFRNITTDTFG